jgi:hypothetical protein
MLCHGYYVYLRIAPQKTNRLWDPHLLPLKWNIRIVFDFIRLSLTKAKRMII